MSQRCKDNEVYYDDSCYDSKTTAARRLLKEKKLNAKDSEKVGCEDAEQVVNITTGRCLDPRNITAKKLLKEQLATKKQFFREVDVKKFGVNKQSGVVDKGDCAKPDQIRNLKTGRCIDVKGMKVKSILKESKKVISQHFRESDLVKFNLIPAQVSKKVVDKKEEANEVGKEDSEEEIEYSEDEKEEASEMDSDEEIEDSEAEEDKENDVDSEEASEEEIEDSEDEEADEDKVESEEEESEEASEEASEVEQASEADEIDEIEEEEEVEQEIDSFIELKDDKKDKKNKKDKKTKKSKKITATDSSWNKEDEKNYESILNLLRKYDETKSFKEKTETKKELFLMKYNNSLEYDRLNEHKEYVFDFNEDIQYNIATNKQFALSNNQKFVKKFISPHTGNTGILLFHGVGVGKTCSAIQIAENFINLFDNKTLIIASKNLHSNFSKELFDIKKIDKKNKTYDGCIGNALLDNIPGWYNMDNVELQKSANVVIKKLFSFSGYQKLVNKIDKIKQQIKYLLQKANSKDPDKRSELYANYIRREFSERVIIIDEAHNIRNPGLITDKLKTDTKQIPIVLRDIMTFARNVRLVLLSATPMFDNPSEIFGLSDILMLNDKLPKISGAIFDETGEIKPKVADFFKYFSRNYVSYMRGENPLYFPLRLHPSIHDKDNVLSSKDHPKIAFDSSALSDKIKYVELYKSTMSKEQDVVITKLKATLKGATGDDSDSDSDSDDDDDDTDIENALNTIEGDKTNVFTEALQISSVYYPVGNISGISNKFNEVFSVVQVKPHLNLRYKPKYSDENELFSEENIGTYAPKIKSIVDCANKSEGIVLIYSEYIYAGVIPICLALESQGYNKFGNKNMLKPISKNSKGSYITITARVDISGNEGQKDLELKTLVSKENQDGSKIKVVIINQVAAEGYDFKNVREIHILEPWYNLNRLEQVIGRGVRNRSHFDQPPEKRNVTIYMHCNLHRDTSKESIDYRTYRLAETKQFKISKIEKIMKEHSIDCPLNKNIIHFKNLPKKSIITSRNVKITDYDINDKDGSRICNYDVCEVVCNNSLKGVGADVNDDDDGDDVELLNTQMLEYDIERTAMQITDYFHRESLVFVSVNDILLNIDEKEQLVNLAISYLSENKLIFTVNNMKGYLNVVNDTHIVFIPEAIKSPSLTLVEQKNLTKRVHINSIQLDFDSLTEESIMTTFNTNVAALTKELKKIIKDEGIREDMVFELVIDAFSYDELKSFINSCMKTYDSLGENMIKALNRTCMTKINADEVLTYNHYEGDRGFNMYVASTNTVNAVSLKRLNTIGIFKKLQSYIPTDNLIAYREYAASKSATKADKMTHFKMGFKSKRNCSSIKIEDFITILNLSELDTDNIIKQEYKFILEKEEWAKHKTKLSMNKDKSLCSVIEYILRYYKRMTRPIVSILTPKK